MKNFAMKKWILMLTMTFSVSAQAEFSLHIDLMKIGQIYLEMTEDLHNNLEALRLIQQEELPVQEQWDIMCEVTQGLNKGVEGLNTVLSKYKVNQKVCAPVTQALTLQSSIIKNCQNFYSKPVPANAKIIIGKLGLSIIQSKMAMMKCYPELANVILTSLK